VEGAEVHVNGQMVGRTPFTGTIKRTNDIRLTVSKTGYTPRTISLDVSVEPVFLG